MNVFDSEKFRLYLMSGLSVQNCEAWEHCPSETSQLSPSSLQAHGGEYLPVSSLLHETEN